MNCLPNVIIGNILNYCGEKIAIWFHKKYPVGLRTRTITKLHLINQQYYHNVRSLDMNNNNKMLTIIFANLSNLIQLECSKTNITDDAFTDLLNLTKLNCWRYKKITSKTFNHLVNLIELDCRYCENITDDAFTELLNLTKLYCGYCKKITGKTFNNLVNLTELNCCNCKNITDDAVTELLNLTKLNCGYCDKITDKTFNHIAANLKYKNI